MCIEECRHPIVVLRGENGRKARFTNKARISYKKYQVDGCLLEKGKSCDAAVSADNELALIEFKGKNVEHAFKQIMDTVPYFKNEQGWKGRICGLIVSTEVPSGSVTANRLRQKFAQAHKSNLKISSSQDTFDLSTIIKFGG